MVMDLFDYFLNLLLEMATPSEIHKTIIIASILKNLLILKLK